MMTRKMNLGLSFLLALALIAALAMASGMPVKEVRAADAGKVDVILDADISTPGIQSSITASNGTSFTVEVILQPNAATFTNADALFRFNPTYLQVDQTSFDLDPSENVTFTDSKYDLKAGDTIGEGSTFNCLFGTESAGATGPSAPWDLSPLAGATIQLNGGSNTMSSAALSDWETILDGVTRNGQAIADQTYTIQAGDKLGTLGNYGGYITGATVGAGGWSVAPFAGKCMFFGGGSQTAGTTVLDTVSIAGGTDISGSLLPSAMSPSYDNVAGEANYGGQKFTAQPALFMETSLCYVKFNVIATPPDPYTTPITFFFQESGLSTGVFISVNNIADAVTGATVTILDPPVADFTMDPADGNITAGDSVTFTNNTTGVVDSYAWDFDYNTGTDSTAETPSAQQYTTTGAYTVRLTATNAAGSHYVEDTVTVSPAAPNYLKVTGTAAMNAGTTNQLTITAYDQYDNVATSYTGDKSITFSGPSVVGANTPTVTDKDGSAVNVGTATTITFTDGVSSAGGLLTAYRVESTTVDADDTSIDSTGDVAYDLDLTVNPGTATYLTVTGTGTMNVGTTNQLTVTAYDAYGQVDTAYTGDKSITFRGPSASPGGNTPTVTDKDGTAVNIGTATPITFTNGVSSAGGLLTAYLPETTTVDADDTSIDSTGDVAYDLDLTVNLSGTAAYLAVTGTATMNAGATNQLTVTAYDAYGNLETAYTGDKNLTYSGPSAIGANTPTVTDKDGTAVDIGTPTPTTFTNGVSTAGGLLTAYKAEVTTVDADDGAGINSTGDAAYDLDLTVNSGAAVNLRVTGTAAMSAGATNQLTLTAYDTYGNVATGYTGDKSITLSGPVAIGANTPTVTDKDGTAVDVGTATTITFTNGVSSAGGLLTAYKAEVTTVDADDTSIDSTGDDAYDLDLTVNPETAANLIVTGTAAMDAGASNQLTLTAYDAYGNTAVTYTGDKSITFSGPGAIGANTPTVTDKAGTAVDVGTATPITFTNGVSTAGGLLTAYKAEVTTVDADDGAGINSTSDTAYDLDLTVNAIALHHVTVTPASEDVTVTQTQQYTASPEDQYGNVLSGITIDWTVGDANAGGINSSGLFTAGNKPATYTDVIVATAQGTGIFGNATANVTGVTATITATLQGGSRPEAKHYIPAEVKVYDEVVTLANIATLQPLVSLTVGSGLTVSSVDTDTHAITIDATGLPVGTLFITIRSDHTLTMQLSNQEILLNGTSSFYMGILHEGDVNNDGGVGGADLGGLIATYWATPTVGDWQDGIADFDENDIVNALDYSLIADNYFEQSPLDADIP